jgi:hypothetical protein
VIDGQHETDLFSFDLGFYHGSVAKAVQAVKAVQAATVLETANAFEGV